MFVHHPCREAHVLELPLQFVPGVGPVERLRLMRRYDGAFAQTGAHFGHEFFKLFLNPRLRRTDGWSARTTVAKPGAAVPIEKHRHGAVTAYLVKLLLKADKVVFTDINLDRISAMSSKPHRNLSHVRCECVPRRS